MTEFARAVALKIVVQSILTPTPVGAFSLEANPNPGGDELQIYMPEDLRSGSMFLTDVEYTLDGGTTPVSLGVDWCGRYSIPVPAGVEASVQIRGVFDGGGGSTIRAPWTDAQTATPMGPSIGFGADTHAGEGGYPLPAGVTEITDPGGTGLEVVGGFIVPAGGGVTAGTIATDGGSFEVVTYPNTKSLRNADEMADRIGDNTLVRGTARFMLRGDDAAIINDDAGRKDIQLENVGYQGTDGYVVVGQHPGEKRPVIRHIAMQNKASGGVEDWWLQWEDIDFRAKISGLASNATGFCLYGRGGVSYVNVLRCTADNEEADDTNRSQYWDAAFNSNYTSSTGWRFEYVKSKNFVRHLHKMKGAYIYSCDFSRFTGDAIQIDGASVMLFTRIHNYLVPNRPDGVSNIVTGTTTDITVSSGDTFENDMYIVIKEATGDWADHINIRYKAEATNGSTGTFPINSTGYTGSIGAIQVHSLHNDCFQSQNLPMAEDGDGIKNSPYGGQFDIALVGNICHFGPDLEPWWHANLQTFLLQDGTGDPSRALIAFNVSTVSPYYHVQSFGRGRLVYLYNTSADGRDAGEDMAGLTVTAALDGDPRLSIVHRNIYQRLADTAGTVPVGDNITYKRPDRNNIFASPTIEGDQSVIFEEYAPEPDYEGYGAIGSRFDWANRTVDFPPLVYNGVLFNSGGTLTPNVCVLFQDGALHYALNDGTTMTAEQIIGASVGGGIVAAGTQASVAGLQDLPSVAPGSGTYTLWTVLVADDDGERSDVDQSPSVTVA